MNRNRQPRGIRTGGQFAHEQHSDDVDTLDTEGDLTGRIATLPPVDFDTEQYQTYVRLMRAQQSVQRSVASLQTQVRTGQERRNNSKLSYDEIMTRAENQRDDQSAMSHVRDMARRGLDQVAVAESERDQAREDFDTYDEMFRRRGGWTRAFLVSGANGHVHKSMECSTCNHNGQSTQFSWMTEYSDHDENEIVDAAGYRACTTCYPSAPVGDERSLPTKMFSEEEKQAEADRQQRDQARTAKQAKAAANAPTASGEPLTVRFGSSNSSHRSVETFKTERTATTWYGDSLFYGRDPQADGAREDIVAAIADKHGYDLDKTREALESKAAAKLRKSGMAYSPPDVDTVTANASAFREQEK